MEREKSFTYTDLNYGLFFEWFGGEYMDVSPWSPEGVGQAIDVINMSGEEFTVTAFKAAIQEYLFDEESISVLRENTVEVYEIENDFLNAVHHV